MNTCHLCGSANVTEIRDAFGYRWFDCQDCDHGSFLHAAA